MGFHCCVLTLSFRNLDIDMGMIISCIHVLEMLLDAFSFMVLEIFYGLCSGVTTFTPMDEDALMDDDARVQDNPLIDIKNKPLYEGSNTSLLSIILLLVNLKVLNGVSNTFFTQILRFEMFYKKINSRSFSFIVIRMQPPVFRKIIFLRLL